MFIAAVQRSIPFIYPVTPSFVVCCYQDSTFNMQAYSKLTAFAALFGLFNSSLAAYTLKDDYSGSNFFSMFDFFTVSNICQSCPLTRS